MSALIAVGALFFGYAALASRLDRWWVSGPMAFVVCW